MHKNQLRMKIQQKFWNSIRRMRNAARGEREVNSPTAHASELWARPVPQEEEEAAQEGLFFLLPQLQL